MGHNLDLCEGACIGKGHLDAQCRHAFKGGGHEPECIDYDGGHTCVCDILRPAYKRGYQAACEELSKPIKNFKIMISKVDSMHRPHLVNGNLFCSCSDVQRNVWIPYPCPTIRALDGEQS